MNAAISAMVSLHPWPSYSQGQVLNQTSAWWMERTAHIIGNSVISIPDPNVTVMEPCDVFPVEFVVRGFMTGAHISAVGGGVCAGCVLVFNACVRILRNFPMLVLVVLNNPGVRGLWVVAI